jgi:DNA repair protein RecN (Recombination protein N)
MAFTLHQFLMFVLAMKLEAKVRKRQKNEKEFAQRMDMLHFQSDEIASAQLVAGEEEQLLEERYS